jgi:hypothetical protein
MAPYFADFADFVAALWQRGPQYMPSGVNRLMRPTRNVFLHPRHTRVAAGSWALTITHENAWAGCFAFHLVIFAINFAGMLLAPAFGVVGAGGLPVLTVTLTFGVAGFFVVFICISLSSGRGNTPGPPFKGPEMRWHRGSIFVKADERL